MSHEPADQTIEIKPIPSGEVLLYKQHIDEDGFYVVECERCPEITLGPTEMGGHAVKVHLRTSFHVETGWPRVKKVEEETRPWVEPERHRQRFHQGIPIPMPKVHQDGGIVEAYGCCQRATTLGHSLSCEAR